MFVCCSLSTNSTIAALSQDLEQALNQFDQAENRPKDREGINSLVALPPYILHSLGIK